MFLIVNAPAIVVVLGIAEIKYQTGKLMQMAVPAQYALGLARQRPVLLVILVVGMKSRPNTLTIIKINYMDRKQVLILTFALVVLFASIFFLARRISGRNQIGASQGLVANNNNIDLSKKDQSVQPENTTDVTGRVAVVSEKMLILRYSSGIISLNLNNDTSVAIISSSDKEPVKGKIIDIKSGDSVRIYYDKTTRNAQLVAVVKNPEPVEKN